MIAAISLTILLSIHKAYSAAPANPATIAAYEDSELKQGRSAYFASDYQSAVEILKLYVQKKPKSVDGHLFLGLSYHELKRFDEAIATLEKAVAIKPKLTQAHLALGQSYLAVKNYDAAVKEYQWLRQQKKESWVAEEFRLYIPAEIAKQYQLPPSFMGQQQADLAAAQPILPMTAELRPTVSYKEKAKYTEAARDQGVQGIVVLSIVFSRDGKVIVVGVIRGLPNGLTQMAIEAARKIRFSPATKDGQPVSVRGHIEFNFTLY